MKAREAAKLTVNSFLSQIHLEIESAAKFKNNFITVVASRIDNYLIDKIIKSLQDEEYIVVINSGIITISWDHLLDSAFIKDKPNNGAIGFKQ